MHKFFADWYRLAHIEPKGEDLPKRWAGVEAFAATLDIPKAVDVARLFLGLAPSLADLRDQFSSLFQKSDPTFPMRDNGLEIRVLAGAVVAHYVETARSRAADALALAVLAGACPGLRDPVLLPEIVTIASNYVFRESLIMRIGGVTEVKSSALKGEQILKDFKAVVAQGNVANNFEALVTPLQKLFSGLESVGTSTGAAMKQVDILIRNLMEQVNVLWWVFAGWSRDLGKPYSGIEVPQACLISGKELADLTLLLPGPIAAPAILDKVLSGGRNHMPPISLEAVVASVDSAGKQKYLEGLDGQLDDLNPVHLALRKSEAGPWIKKFESTTGVKVKKALDPVSLAMQVYTERLLQKAARG